MPGDRRLWLGLAVSALFVLLLLWQVDTGEVLEALRGVRPGWLMLALAVYMAGLWLRALRWKLVLGPSVAVGMSDTFSLVLIGYAANNVLPVRGGEVVRAGLLQRRHGAPWALGLGTILVERVLDGIVLAVFLAVAVALAGGSPLLRGLALAAGGGSVVAALLIVGLDVAPRRAGALVGALPRVLPGALQRRARSWIEGFVLGLTTLHGPRDWTRVIAVTAASWALEAASYWLAGLAFGLDIPAPLYLGLCAAANLAIAAPSTAGGVGPFEFFARTVAIAHGVASGAATAYAIGLHALILLPVVAIGAVLVWRQDLGLRGVLAARPPPAAGEQEPPAQRPAAE